MNIRKILVPTDFSTASRAAIDPARTMAKKFGAQIELLHVCDEPPTLTLSDMVVVRGESITLGELMRRQASQKMEELVSELRSDGIVLHGRVASGGPWRTIVDVLTREQFDLAVIATTGHRGVERVLLGSVAENVVRRAPCPVLVIHPPRRD